MRYLRSRWLWLAAVSGMGVVLIFRLRTALNTQAAVEAPVELSPPLTLATPTPQPSMPPFQRDLQALWSQVWVRRVVAVGVTLLIVWLLLNLNRNYATMLLGGLVLVGAVVTANRIGYALQTRIRIQWIGKNRTLVAQVLGLAGVVVVFASAFAFRREDAEFVLLPAAALLVTGGVLLGAATWLANLTAWPTLVAAQPVHLPRPSWRALCLGTAVLAVWGFIRILNTPLPWEGQPGVDALSIQVLLALKNTTIPLVTSASGEAQFGLFTMGTVLLALGLGAVRLPRIHGLLFVMGLSLLILLAEINGKVYDILALKWVTTHAQFALLCTSLTLMVVGVGRVRAARPRLSVSRAGWVLGGITLLGLLVRFWQLDTSVRVLVDELFFTTAIHDLRVNPHVGLLTPYSSISAFPYVYPYFQFHTVEWLGRNFTGLRAASAVMGTVMIPLTYLLGKTLFDRKTALVGALVLAVFPVHVHFSRLGVIEMGGALAGLLAMLFLARAVLANRRVDYAAAGVMLGLTHYFHEGSRLLFTPLALLWLVAVLVLWRQRLRGRVIYSVLLVVMLVIVAVPIYYTLLGIERPLFARLTDNGVNLEASYFANLLATGDFMPHLSTYTYQTFMIYVQHPDTTLFYGPEPLTTIYMLPALLLGVCALAWRWRTPGALLLFLWVISTSLGNNVLSDPANAPRYVVVFPALALIAAVGIRHAVMLIVPRTRVPGNAVLVGLALMLAVLETDFYFNEHLPTYNRDFRQRWGHRDAQDAAFRSLNFPYGTHIHVIAEKTPAPNYAAGLLTFMRPDMTFHYARPQDLTEDYFSVLDTTVDHAFYVEPNDSQSVRVIGEHFRLLPPESSPFADLPPESVFMLYYAPLFK